MKEISIELIVSLNHYDEIKYLYEVLRNEDNKILSLKQFNVYSYELFQNDNVFHRPVKPDYFSHDEELYELLTTDNHHSLTHDEFNALYHQLMDEYSVEPIYFEETFEQKAFKEELTNLYNLLNRGLTRPLPHIEDIVYKLR